MAVTVAAIATGTGDFNGDGSVDFADFFEFVDAFGQSGQAKLLAMARDMIGLPSETELQQNAPNPFNNETVISWFLLEPGPARLEVFALNGQRVTVLRQGPQQAGFHRIHWDGRDDMGRSLASGVYLYRLVSAETVLTRKLTLLR
ncbi:MAG: T9SS type A sorting domain-containing protein [Acidobacteria bacterium]|nr:T9SS type A sorting domain-containing protein [Acidobacteriota bacterium]